jgi:hypothetical protein
VRDRVRVRLGLGFPRLAQVRVRDRVRVRLGLGFPRLAQARDYDP